MTRATSRRLGLCAILLLLGCTGGQTSGDAGGDGSIAVVAPGTPAGSCLVEYNGALVSPPASTCCLRLGSPNTCDPGVQCTAGSGSPCCLLYATPATLVGQTCCLYSNGDPVTDGRGNDATAACAALINYGR